MRGQLRSFLIGFAVVSLGWYLLLVMSGGAWLEFLAVLLGLIAALAARLPIGLLGAIAGFVAWYAAFFVGGNHLDGEWQGPALMFTMLIASGFAGGLALLWLRTVRRTAAPS
jgi:hypothetical protein